jgi:hypothetical protein
LGAVSAAWVEEVEWFAWRREGAEMSHLPLGSRSQKYSREGAKAQRDKGAGRFLTIRDGFDAQPQKQSPRLRAFA